MPKRAITQLFYERITPPKAGRADYADSRVPGLKLRVSASGVKSWSVVAKVGGAPFRETLGTIDSVAEAHRRALASLEAARAGVNPVAAKRAAATRVAGNTASAAVTRYLATVDRDLAPKTAKEWRRIFEHDVLRHWGERPLAAITKADVLLLLNAKAASREKPRKGFGAGAGVQANRILGRLRTFFGWAIANDLCTADPTAGVRRAARETPRDRVLSDEELKLFWLGCDRLGWPFGSIGQLLLLTGQRVSEVGGMRWAELDRVWTIPGRRTKNRKAHEVALSALAVEIIVGSPRVGDLVFTANAVPPSGYSRAKVRLDGLMPGTPAWSWHDLRRSMTTGLARIGIPPHVADKVLNHTGGTIRGVAAVYNKFAYLDERAKALEAWGRFVEGLVRPVQSNVVALAGRQY